MRALAAVAGAMLAIVATIILGDLASQAVRGHLERLLHGCIRLAARRLPAEIRADLAQEWGAELHEILYGGHARRLARLYRGTRYALGFLRAAPRISRDLRDATVQGHTDHGSALRRRFDAAAVLLHMTISSSYLVGVLILFDLFGVSRLVLGQSGGVPFWIEVIIRVVVAGLIFSVIERCRRKLTERTRPSRAQVFLSAAAGAVAPYVAVMTSAGMIGDGRNYPGSLTQRVVVGVVGGIALALLYGWIAMADDTRRRRRKAALPAVPGRRP